MEPTKKWSEIREGSGGIEAVLRQRMRDMALSAGEDALEQTIKTDDQVEVAKLVAKNLIDLHGEMGALMVVGSIYAHIRESADARLADELGTNPDGTVRELSTTRGFVAAHHSLMEALSGPAFQLAQNIWAEVLIYHQTKAVADLSEG